MAARATTVWRAANDTILGGTGDHLAYGDNANGSGVGGVDWIEGGSGNDQLAGWAATTSSSAVSATIGYTAAQASMCSMEASAPITFTSMRRPMVMTVSAISAPRSPML